MMHFCDHGAQQSARVRKRNKTIVQNLYRLILSTLIYMLQIAHTL